MEVYERLDDLVDLIEGARGVPLSDSCVVNRTIALELLEAVRALMPASLRDAATILADRDDVLEDAAREAESRIAAAQDEADATLSRTENEAAPCCPTPRSRSSRCWPKVSRTPRGPSTGHARRLSALWLPTPSGWRPNVRPRR